MFDLKKLSALSWDQLLELFGPALALIIQKLLDKIFNKAQHHECDPACPESCCESAINDAVAIIVKLAPHCKKCCEVPA